MLFRSPVRILPSEVQREFVQPHTLGLAYPVSREEQTLAVTCPRLKIPQMLDVQFPPQTSGVRVIVEDFPP